MKRHIRIKSCPVREEYWESGDIVLVNNGQARLSGNWFTIGEDWAYEEIGEYVIIGGADHGATTHAVEVIRAMESQGMSCTILPVDVKESTPEPMKFEIGELYITREIDVKHYEGSSVNPMDNKKGGKKKGRNKFGR